MISIDLLGFLRDINDSNERSVKEQELFKSTKKLMIEFLETVLDLNKNRIKNSHIAILQKDSNHNIYGHSSVTTTNQVLICHTLYIISKKYKLTKNLKELIFNIIYYMPANLFQDFMITTSEPVYFMLEEEEEEDVTQLVTRHQYTPNIENITLTLPKLQDGEWDNFIKRSIKELG